MNDPGVKQYIQILIEPLYLKIQQLQKENNQLKKRVGTLQTILMTQSSKSYMKNTVSRQNHLQESLVTRKDDENRSSSSGKHKTQWKSNTKIQETKPVNREPVHYQKMKLKPPLPRMNSKTPTKTTDSLLRQKSPLINKKVVTSQTIKADEKQILHFPPENSMEIQKITNPSKTNAVTSDLDQNFSSKGSKMSLAQMGKPTIYIQKDAKKSSIINSPTQSPNSQRSNVTEKGMSKSSDANPELINMTKSQPSLQ